MQIPITTTLSKGLYDQIEIFAKKTGKKKNQIIEESISQYFLSEKKKRMAESFKRAATDIEVVNMAEEGLSDYLEHFAN